MNNLAICTLYSGSKGNCTYVRCGKDEILIDAGRSLRALCAGLRQIGSDLDRIKAIFITHEHTDHISALEMMAKHRAIPVHMTADSAQRVLETTTYVQNNLVLHTPLYTERVGDMEISSFQTPHDSAMSVGYTITSAAGEKIGIATDIGHVTDTIRENLLGATAVVLESNHDVGMLKNGPYPEWLKTRIMSPRGHLSNDDCGTFLEELTNSGTEHVLLAHLSAENNTPHAALRSARKHAPQINIQVAKEAEPTRLL